MNPSDVSIRQIWFNEINSIIWQTTAVDLELISNSILETEVDFISALFF